ncbi:MAG: [Fe-Fe] hydrogenase large subunit C-terminal domain-containing protein [Oscillospiraceae bacterium]|nr:[Fe-Fe] hydrogenase large subunit C-terminal domain-containing protein [Oscillospiraceae bacterium]
MAQNLIFTDEQLCFGCNKCILKCPTHANDAILSNGENKIHINATRCVGCGACITVCDHEARSFNDDTQRFFEDLAAGVPISVIVAPAARTNFQNLENLFGYLKSCGVNLIYDVSYGADICTWGYIRAIQQQNLQTVIAQPCPVVVNYIEKFAPHLIPCLAPIQSPALCTAIYLRKYAQNTDKLAFLSPCVAKKDEFDDDNTHGHVSYNVTYKKLLAYLQKKGVNLSAFAPAGYDNPAGAWGVTFSRPGGLKENVRFYLGDDAWIKQVEGTDHLTAYFNQYAAAAKAHKPLPLLVDVLNCEDGCNLGTGTAKAVAYDDIDYTLNKRKAAVTKQDMAKVAAYFDDTLDVTDFYRTYTDKSGQLPADNIAAIEEVFHQLGKHTEKDRNVNCFCCGYGSCQSFALAVANGHNHKENCIRYAQVANAQKLTSFDDMIAQFTAEMSRMNQDIQAVTKSSRTLNDISMQTKIISINASIEAAIAGSAGRGFSVIAHEMKNLAEKSAAENQQNTDNATQLLSQIDGINTALEQIRQELHHVMQQD